MTILAIDTSTKTARVALVNLHQGTPTVVFEVTDSSGNHSDRLISLVDDCLRGGKVELAELRAIAIGAGPGSFTGLRIGMATAKGLALAADTPLWIASSLAAVAASAKPHANAKIIAVVVDGHRGEVFVGLFDARTLEPIGEEHVLTPGDLKDDLQQRGADATSTIIVGDGARLFPDAVAAVGALAVDADVHPSPVGVAAMAARGPKRDLRSTATPTYIRPSEAEVRFPNGNPGGTFAPQGAKKPSS